MFFLNATATTEIYTLSLHDALPICGRAPTAPTVARPRFAQHRSRYSRAVTQISGPRSRAALLRSEEHTSELQSRENLVCRLLLEKKKQNCREAASASSSC